MTEQITEGKRNYELQQTNRGGNISVQVAYWILGCASYQMMLHYSEQSG